MLSQKSALYVRLPIYERQPYQKRTLPRHKLYSMPIDHKMVYILCKVWKRLSKEDNNNRMQTQRKMMCDARQAVCSKALITEKLDGRYSQ
jgi:hypothetical protein